MTMQKPRIDWPAVQTVAGEFRLAMPRAPIGGRLGERLGSGTGSSLEFQDYRRASRCRKRTAPFFKRLSRQGPPIC